MKRYVLILCSIMLFSMLSGSIGQEGFKFGVVDTQRLLGSYGKFTDVNEILQTARKRLSDKLEGKFQEIRTLKEKLTKTELFLEKPQTEELQNQIKTKEDEFLRDQQDGEKALFDKEKELIEPILKEIEELIKKTGKEQNFDLIISKQAALYYNEKFDITDSLIEIINKLPENNAEKKPANE